MKQLVLLGCLITLIACQKDLNDPAAPGVLVPRTVDQDASLPSLAVNGTLLHAEAIGLPTDPIIIMLHGGPGGDYRSLLNAREFAQDGFYVVFFDQRSTGLSQREDRSQLESNLIQLMIDDLDALISHYRLSADQKVFLVGHSWGAMLATAYINQYPEKISGAILAEPGGLTWEQTKEYLSRSNKIELFSEALNDALFPEQIFVGRSEDEILDYKAAYFITFENAPGNTIGNAGPYPFWRNGAVVFQTSQDYAERVGFDFTTNLHSFTTPVLFLYSELNRAYGMDWAQTVSAAYPNVELAEVMGSGHEMLYFGWEDFYPRALTYLNLLK